MGSREGLGAVADEGKLKQFPRVGTTIDEDDFLDGFLSAPEEAFCQAYVSDLKRNATAAVMAAGYTDNKNSAGVIGHRLLRNVSVKARIRQLEREALEAGGYDLEALKVSVMREYARIAFSDITDVVHISPEGASEGPERVKIHDRLAQMNGGQRLLDFGETLVAPTTNLPADVTAAIKGIKAIYTGKSGVFRGFEITMHDKMNALGVIAEACGIKKNQVALTDADGGPLVFNWSARPETPEAEEAAADA